MWETEPAEVLPGSMWMQQETVPGTEKGHARGISGGGGRKASLQDHLVEFWGLMHEHRFANRREQCSLSLCKHVHWVSVAPAKRRAVGRNRETTSEEHGKWAGARLGVAVARICFIFFCPFPSFFPFFLLKETEELLSVSWFPNVPRLLCLALVKAGSWELCLRLLYGWQAPIDLNCHCCLPKSI